MNNATWKCPNCKATIQAIATMVTHICPSNNHALTVWEKVSKK